MIDWTRVQELRSEIGEAGFAEVVELFLEEVETVLARLDPGSGPKRLGEDLHFLKGCAWNLGFVEFGASCQTGEREALANRCSADRVQDLAACYRKSRDAFLGRISSEGSSAA